jgi:hypothetical protein
VLRYDINLPFSSPSSWSAYDAGNSGGLTNTKGYNGAVVVGNFIYFAPYNDGPGFHGKVFDFV